MLMTRIPAGEKGPSLAAASRETHRRSGEIHLPADLSADCSKRTTKNQRGAMTSGKGVSCFSVKTLFAAVLRSELPV